MRQKALGSRCHVRVISVATLSSKAWRACLAVFLYALRADLVSSDVAPWTSVVDFQISLAATQSALYQDLERCIRLVVCVGQAMTPPHLE